MTIYVGFEIEVEGMAPNKQKSIKDLIKNTRDITGWAWGYIHSYHSNTQYSLEGKWRVERDGSLCGGAEFISPVMPIEEALEQLFKFLKQIDVSNCTTSDRCGLHMGISSDNMTLNSNFNLTHFISAVNQRKLYSLWTNRLKTYNSYCIPMKNILKCFYNKNNVTKDIKEFSKYIVKNRDNVINLRESHDTKYFEIRLMGGKDYHKKIDKIKTTAYYFAKLIKEAEAAEPKQYKKIISYMNKTNDNIISKIWIPRSYVIPVKMSTLIKQLRTLSNLSKYSKDEIDRFFNKSAGPYSCLSTKIKNYITSMLFVVTRSLNYNNFTTSELKELTRAINEALYYLLKCMDTYLNPKFCRKLIKNIHNNSNIFRDKPNLDFEIKIPESETTTGALWLAKYIKVLDTPVRKKYVESLGSNAAKFLIKHRKKEINGMIRLMNVQAKKTKVKEK